MTLETVRNLAVAARALSVCGGFPVQVNSAFATGNWTDERGDIAHDEPHYRELVRRALSASPIMEVWIRPAPEVKP